MEDTVVSENDAATNEPLRDHSEDSTIYVIKQEPDSDNESAISVPNCGPSNAVDITTEPTTSEINGKVTSERCAPQIKDTMNFQNELLGICSKMMEDVIKLSKVSPGSKRLCICR